jgi:hypothetical protein
VIKIFFSVAQNASRSAATGDVRQWTEYGCLRNFSIDFIKAEKEKRRKQKEVDSNRLEKENSTEQTLTLCKTTPSGKKSGKQALRKVGDPSFFTSPHPSSASSNSGSYRRPSGPSPK